MKEGIINLLKPAGMTSHDAVSMLRRLTKIKRIGHTGTLDPMAAGVLPLCIGSAARINEYLDLDRKVYRCEMQLGIETETQDIWGTVTADNRSVVKDITREDIEAAIRTMDGIVLQSPPSYSAVRVDGKRLYEYAREGTLIEGKKRPVYLSDAVLLDFNPETGRVMFEITCSKGTYVRTICCQMGKQLGCGAAMSFLLRTRTGSFSLENSVTIEELQASEDWSQWMLPADIGLNHFGKIRLRPERTRWFLNGGYLIERDGEILQEPLASVDKRELQMYMENLPVPDKYPFTYCVYSHEDIFLGTAVYQPQEKRYVADKVFYK